MFLCPKTEYPLAGFLGDDGIGKVLRKLRESSNVFPETIEARKKYLRRLFRVGVS